MNKNPESAETRRSLWDCEIMGVWDYGIAPPKMFTNLQCSPIVIAINTNDIAD